MMLYMFLQFLKKYKAFKLLAAIDLFTTFLLLTIKKTPALIAESGS